MMMIGGVGSLLFAVAPSLTWLTVGRGLIGIGMASILMGSMKAFSKWYPPARFATMTGLLMGIASLGSLSAATPLAWLNAQVGWRAVFVGMGLVTIVVAVIMAVFGRNAPPDDEQQGAAPLARAQGGIGDVLRDKRFWLMVPISMVAVGSYGGFQGLWIGPYLFDNYRLGEIEIGNLILLMAIGGTVGSLSSGWLADRFDLVRVVLIAAMVFVLAQVVLALYPPIFIVGGVLLFFGYTGAFNVLVLSHARRLFPDEMTGQALTAINLSMFVGIFLVQWLSGVVIGQFPVTSEGVYSPQAYTVVLLVMAAFCLGAIAIYARFLWGRKA